MVFFFFFEKKIVLFYSDTIMTVSFKLSLVLVSLLGLSTKSLFVLCFVFASFGHSVDGIGKSGKARCGLYRHSGADEITLSSFCSLPPYKQDDAFITGASQWGRSSHATQSNGTA